MLNVVTANVYRWNKSLDHDLAVLRALHPDFVGMQECQRVRKFGGFDRIANHRDSDNAGEVAGFLATSLPLTGFQAFQATRDTKTKVGPARSVVVALSRVDGVPVAFINTHMNAAVVDKDGKVRSKWVVTREYVKHAKLLQRTIRYYQQLGYSVVVTGDFNVRKQHGKRDWKYSPYRLFKRCGLRYVYNGLDGIAYDPRDWDEVEVRPVNNRGSDHKFLHVRLKRKAKK